MIKVSEIIEKDYLFEKQHRPKFNQEYMKNPNLLPERHCRNTIKQITDKENHTGAEEGGAEKRR
jgi:hypothetical protein